MAHLQISEGGASRKTDNMAPLSAIRNKAALQTLPLRSHVIVAILHIYTQDESQCGPFNTYNRGIYCTNVGLV